MTALGLLAFLAWLYLVGWHGGFWRGRERLGAPPPRAGDWPEVVAVVPARDEAELVGDSVAALLAQDYPGPFRVVLVDDHSADGTAAAARAAARNAADRLAIVAARATPPGWAGKPWAMAEGVAGATLGGAAPRYLWFTDADIRHQPGVLSALVAKAERDRLDLVSEMVLLDCRAGWERLLIPAFVFFFQKLYPFAWVNDPARRAAAAAGGSLLARAEALAAAGGLPAIAGALIDDCALAARIKHRPGGGRIWLGLGARSRSLRPYGALAPIWRMVARSAYTQLGYSPPLLALTLAGMGLLYLAPPLLALAWPWHGETLPALLGLAAWGLMAGAFLPTLRLYGQSAALAPALPVAGALYAAMTLDSALAHWRGRGGAWKGRVAPASEGLPSAARSAKEGG